MSKVTPFLMFNDQLESAIEFYTSTVPGLQGHECRPPCATRGTSTQSAPTAERSHYRAVWLPVTVVTT